ncbi:antibiotic biosynthesis monooxygenase [Sulfitobacter sp. LCG007]
MTGTIEVPAERVDAMKDAAATMARATREEEGCFDYAFWQDVETPTRFRVYEEWRDIDCLKAHGATRHMANWRAALDGIGVVSRDIKRFVPGHATQL